jgi:protein-disulfide isomerase
LASVGLYARRELAQPLGIPSRGAARPPKFFKDWAGYAVSSHRLGPATAALTIVSLADLECPFCRAFHQDEERFRQQHPDEVALVFVQYPLSMHRFANLAARAAECANDQRRFEAFVAKVFEKQDSLGLKEWSSFASEAGIRDTVSFRRCVSARSDVEAVRAGKAFGDYVELTGTPTVLVNGWRLPHAPKEADLEESLRLVHLGKPPVPSAMNAVGK